MAMLTASVIRSVPNLTVTKNLILMQIFFWRLEVMTFFLTPRARDQEQEEK